MQRKAARHREGDIWITTTGQWLKYDGKEWQPMKPLVAKRPLHD